MGTFTSSEKLPTLGAAGYRQLGPSAEMEIGSGDLLQMARQSTRVL